MKERTYKGTKRPKDMAVWKWNIWVDIQEHNDRISKDEWENRLLLRERK